MKRNKPSFISDLLELAKVRITIAVTITTTAGYVIFHHGFSPDMIWPVVGLFLTACGSAVINQIQERKKDALMERTKERPLSSGRISYRFAVTYAFTLSFSGLWMLWQSSGFIPMALAALALIWYNLIYTNLKKVTAFAVVPGSVIGSIPPAVGWTAAGGSLADPALWYLCFFFFIWQVPHFWLLLLKYGKQYEQAGFPSLTGIYTDFQLKKITFIWAVAMAVSGMALVFTGLSSGLFAKTGLIFLSLLIIFLFSKLVLKKYAQESLKKYFIVINFYMLSVVALLMIDTVWN